MTKYCKGVQIIEGLLCTMCIGSLAWGHPANFSMWSGDIQLFNLAEKIMLKINFGTIEILARLNKLLILDVSRPHTEVGGMAPGQTSGIGS